MLFNSYIFLFAFLPLTFAGFVILSRFGQARVVVPWLLAMSLVFYGWWQPVYLTLLLGSVIANFLIGAAIVRRTQVGQSSGVLLGIGVIGNLVLIGWFKYLGFFAGISDALLGSGFGFIEVALPLAISFFTFQQIAYLVDCHRGLAGEPNIFKYGLFVTFFPQLIAGPIVHHSEVMRQYETAFSRGPSSLNVAIGVTLIAVGLFKKIVIADNLAVYATPIFDDADAGATIGFARAWAGTLAYTLQIYFDFSGYSDMAVGLARLFGIRLPINFFSPYRATSIIEFWRRWHITLSRFLRDYLYIPLGGSRHGSFRRYSNLMTTMLLGGLWHGAGWTFVVWGGLHGIFLIINHAWQHLTKNQEWLRGNIFAQGFSWVLTILAVSVAWVFFRADTFDGALAIFYGLAGINDILPAMGLVSGEVYADSGIGKRVWRWLALAAVIAVLCPNIYQIMRRYRPVLGIPNRKPLLPLRWRPTVIWAGVTGIVLVASLVLLTQVSEFLYFRF